MLALLFSETLFYSNQLFDPIYQPKYFAFYFLSSLFLIYFFIKKFFISEKATTFSFNLSDILIVVFYLTIVLQLLFENHSSFIPDQFIVLTICILVYFSIRNEITFNSITKIDRFVILFNIIILKGIFQCIIGLLQFTGVVQNFNRDFKIGGTYGNPNPLTNLIAGIFPFSFSILLYSKKGERKFSYYLSLISTPLFLVVALLCQERTSWIAILLSALLILENKYSLFEKIKLVLNTLFKRIAAIAVLIALIISFSYFIYNYKYNSTFGRVFIWKISLNIVKDNQLVGVGYGKYFSSLNDYKALYFKTHQNTEYEERITSDSPYAFNEYLQTTVELGFIGGILLIFIIYSISKDQSNRKSK